MTENVPPVLPSAVDGLAAFAALDEQAAAPLRHALELAAADAPLEADDAARLAEPYLLLLDALGDGVKLTSAGHLPAAVVRTVAERTGVIEWADGNCNQEARTPAVPQLRSTARAAGLVSLRKGRLAPTGAARRMAGDPVARLHHLLARLPLGKDGFEKDAGWAALIVVGSGEPAQRWLREASELLYARGWRSSADAWAPPAPFNPTLDTLQLLAGAARTPWPEVTGTDEALAALARSALARSELARSEPAAGA